MLTALNVLTDELRRLKATGVRTVDVSEESLQALRSAVEGHIKKRSVEHVSAAQEIKPLSVSQVQGSPVTKVKVAAPFAVAPYFKLEEGSKETRLAALKQIMLEDPVYKATLKPGKQLVIGCGALDAKIMFVADAPGLEEENKGEPFIGPAGQLLDRMISGMGLTRSAVYMGSILNVRPEPLSNEAGEQAANRTPTSAELAYSMPYLKAQIEIVQPSLIVALGSSAAQGLLGNGAFKALGDVRGQWKEYNSIPLMITYHPSYILRNPTNRSKRMIWDDLLKVMECAMLPITEKQKAYFLDTK